MNKTVNQLTRIFASAALALVLGVFAAPSAVAATGSGAPDVQSGKAWANYEAWLTKQVHHELAMLPWFTVFDNLEYQVYGTTVILEGQVVRASLKPDAENAVKHIEGVTKVVNNIEVLPISPMNNQIRMQTFRAIYSEPSLQIYGPNPVSSIHIVVKNGNVTLVGVVNNETDKNLSGIRANGVPNVFSVTNDLQVGKS